MNKSGAVAVIGAGLMGHALALVHAIGGCRVKMQDISIKQLESGMELITNLMLGTWKLPRPIPTMLNAPINNNK